jgi:protease I
MKKALLIIAPEKFRDEEYFHPREELEAAGIKTITASLTTAPAKGAKGAVVTPDISLGEVKVEDYGAILFIGGGGSSIYFDNEIAHNIARDAQAKGKVLGAICIAPSILANAGLLKGKKVTSFPSEQSSLRAKGAEFTGNGVTVDGKLVTADGPASAREFGRAVAKLLR